MKKQVNGAPGLSINNKNMLRKYKVTQNKCWSKNIISEKTFFNRKNAEKYFDKIHDVNNKNIITTLSRLDKK